MTWNLLVLLFLVVVGGCAEQYPDMLITEGYDEQEMNAAIARARAEVDSFIAELLNPRGTVHAVKVPIQDTNGVEYFWLTDLSYKDGQFEGTIGNEPGIVKNVKLGQTWTVKKEDISDWMYVADGKIYGNYTLRPLLKAMPKERADEFRSLLAEP